ncbi:SAM-dependent methyltransferase [Amycolatopsis antarctica]|uniref:SAM-dependent methyltransferase n=1 Tax=Amycolatopsis antarctica TaxID=1854586 RepID=A0A263D3R3_9PSEU|nr:SAM-dependent methyltransferase [Amycolatopsis antarctica]OZM72096.1 SAM-dependent methyltransferase [Amycolatopsis antarctica]
MNPAVPRAYFDRMYAGSPDPWGLAERWYERRKYDCSLAALPRRRYRSGFEPGCSVGVLSARLADRCDRLLAVDPVPAAVGQAADRLAGHPHARAGELTVPGEWPEERFDLIVVSELAYYLDEDGRAALWARAAGSLEPDGTLLAVHWRPRVPGYAADGDQVHRELARQESFRWAGGHQDPDFLLDVYRPADGEPRSVAQREGLR